MTKPLKQQSDNFPDPILDDDTPPKGKSKATLQEKMTQRIESEVNEAIGDVERRKEYREALARHGVTFDFLVENLMNIATGGEKDSDKIRALQVIAKSLGVDKTNSKEEEEKGGSWEDALNGAEDTPQEERESDDIGGEYEVNEPPVPQSALRRQENEKKLGQSIYDDV